MLFILVGTKSDLSERKAVHPEAAQNIASQINVKLFETSAKTGENIENAISALGDMLMDKQSANYQITSPKGGKKPKKRILKLIFKNIFGK